MSNLPFGGTDCALPMVYALDHEREIDTFVILTDSETWAGDVHPAQALRDYRRASGIDARLVLAEWSRTASQLRTRTTRDSSTSSVSTRRRRS